MIILIVATLLYIAFEKVSIATLNIKKVVKGLKAKINTLRVIEIFRQPSDTNYLSYIEALSAQQC